MKLKKVISVGCINDNLNGANLTRNLTGNQRVSLLESIRRDMQKVTRYECSGRLRRVLEVVEQKKS